MTGYLQDRIAEAQTRVFAVGAIALLATVIGAFFNAREFFVSYWFGYLFWLGLALGCLIITMIHHLTGGRWGHPIRRFTEAGFSTLPLMALLFIPILFGLRHLYPWANPDQVLAFEVLRKKQPYLSVTFYIIRVILYFTIWLLLAWRLRHWSLEQDETADSEPTRRLLSLSGPGVVILPITATFAYIDWIMSMEREWYSTIFALVILAGQVVAGYAFTVVLLKIFERQKPISSSVRRIHFHQLGNLMLTFVLFWTYVAFGQLLIIYSGNLPDEISWYLHRIAGGCQYVVGAVALFHFFLPFFLLLFKAVKKSSTALATIAIALLIIHLVYMHWMITPSVFPNALHVTWMDFAAPIGIGGIWIGVFLWALRKAPLIPLNDPRILEEIATLETR